MPCQYCVCTHIRRTARGFLIGELIRLLRNSLRKNMWTIGVSSVIFAGMRHGLKQVIPCTLPNSVGLGLIAVWTDSILLPIAIHCRYEKA